jgi:two-component system sensor histidine kinase VicK
MHEQFAEIKKLGCLSRDGVFIYDLDKKQFIYTNKVFTEIFFVEGKNLFQQSRDVLRSMFTEDEVWLAAQYDELLKTHHLNNAEFRFKFPDRMTHQFSCDAYLLEGHVVAGFVKDITRIKEHENFVVEYTAKKDAFLDMITHNLSGPLALTRDILGWMSKSVKKNDPEEMESLMTLLQDTTQQCIDIVDDFLREEHSESQTIYVKKTRIDILSKIHAVLEKLQEMNPDKKFSLVTHLENVNLNTDSVKFFQIIHNLLSNAIKFTGKNGRIEIAIDEEAHAFVFAVRDNGIGIPADLQQYIFDKRSFAGRAGLKGEPSNGIGLSIIKKLVELLGGEIWFESQEKMGSVFFVRLQKE